MKIFKQLKENKNIREKVWIMKGLINTDFINIKNERLRKIFKIKKNKSWYSCIFKFF